jgi:hypothetical protein
LSENDWIDIRVTKDLTEKEIVKFSVNLSFIISGDIYSIIRYDNAHGFTHIDRYGKTEKEIIKNKSKKQIMKLARTDISNNWKKYRKMVEKIIKGGSNE